MPSEINLDWKISTLALHAGDDEKYADSLITPIFATSTFSFPDVDVGRKRFSGEKPGFIYSRLGNPTVNASEKSIAILEGSNLIKKGINVEGHAFGTGMAAIASVILSLTKSGDSILATTPVYGGTSYFFDGIMKSYFVHTDYVNTAGIEGVQQVVEAIDSRTSLIYLETPTNPNLIICDIEEISKIGRENNIPIVVDNTFATPIIQRPLELGADISLHSTTKYLNGHGTTCSGILASKLTGETKEKLHFVKKNLGATQSPFDAFLVLNGMKTLPLRMERHCSNAKAIAEFLSEHSKVKEVFYPGLPSHPQYGLAKKQMDNKFGGMIAFELKGGLESGEALMNNVEIITLAPSLGCSKSLIQHPASMSHAKVPREKRIESGITDGLVRFSVGLEDIDDLIEDLGKALSFS
ncbi:MAG: trans-sulfuration enzyme family protein [Candidatus Thorarchaeota archaeon]